ncbi:STAS domain-containing protein [Streptomyces durmitorensis]|uniref:Anti-sigma factor antagonist n=1 Tax=Streptomyces durmitorensis TaxID=319947 RepID=A0ABY4Q3Z3_9ACTN|nr:STAS domain-containing protein [Streptomyces durmitorensis]UQT60915.1 STAS domain-containing protein [Streptomyces durmitorensis]
MSGLVHTEDAIMINGAPPASNGHLHTYRTQGHLVLEFRGAIDISAALDMAPALDAHTARPALTAIIDLSPVDFFDCSGLRLLCRARRRILEHGGRLQLVCSRPLTLHILRVTGLLPVFDPVPCLADALGQPDAEAG